METILSLSSVEQLLRLLNAQNNTEFTTSNVTLSYPSITTQNGKNTEVLITPKTTSRWRGSLLFRYKRLNLANFINYGSTVFLLDQGSTFSTLLAMFNAHYKSNLIIGEDVNEVNIPQLDYLISSLITITAIAMSYVYIGSITVQCKRKQGAVLTGGVTIGTNSPQTTHSHCGKIIGDRYYIFGGSNGSSNVNTLRIYNLLNKTWSTGATGPSARLGSAAAEIGNTLYICCGSNLRDLWAYNTTNNTWVQRASLAGSKMRQFASMCSINNKLYFHGGSNSSKIFKDLWCYDPNTNSWTELSESPTTRHHHTMVAMSGKLFIVGGSSQLNTIQLESTFDCYDIATNTWSTLAPCPDTKESAVMVEIDGYFYYYGGGSSSLSSNKLQRYDPVANTWTTVGNIGTARTRHIMDKYNGRLISYGGQATVTLNSVTEIY